MKEVNIISKIVGRAVDSTTFPKAESQMSGLSDFLPKSIWDKVFKLVTDEAGNEHLFSKLPFASKYGITMFADDGSLNLPNIYDGLPIDWQTIYWEDVKDAEGNVIGRVLKSAGGGGEGGTVNGITLEQLEAYLGVNKYATQPWVEGKGYLSAITSKLVTDALGFTPYDSAKLSGELGKYLPLTGGRIDGKLGIGCTPTVFVDILNNIASTNTFVHTKRGDTGYGISFGIGGGGVNRGLYDDNLNKWIIYADDVKTNLTQNIWINQDEWNGGLKLNRNTSGGGCGISVYSNGEELGQFGIAGNNRFEFDVVSDGVNGTKFYINPNGDGFVEGEFSMRSAKINGGKLTYDSTNKYWKLEGDLLVTGGITMFGADSDFKPSTIMDGVIVDGTTIRKNPSSGALEFIGSINGGVAGSVDWSNITSKPTFATVATSGKYSDLIGRPTLLSSFTDDVVRGKYLPLMGGALTTAVNRYYADGVFGINLANSDIVGVNSLYFNDLSQNNAEGIAFARTNGNWDILRAEDGVLKFAPNVGLGTTSTDAYTIINSNGGKIDGDLTVQSIVFQGTNEINSINNSRLHLNYRVAADVTLCVGGGNVGIGYSTPTEKVDILNNIASTNTFVHTKRGDTGYGISFGIGGGGVNRGLYDDNLSRWIIYADSSRVNLSKDIWITQDAWANGFNLNRSVAGGGCAIAVWSAGTHIGNFGINGSKQFEFNNVTNGVAAVKFTVDGDGNGLFYGGITMYSDQRKKTILNHVELTLQQIADAPLIEHYYNSDEKRTTHVGSVAQYWAGLNDWFCKLDGEGFYTMEIQNAALASAISIARELQRCESKTDKKIRLLKKRIGELEYKIEELEKKGS